MDKVQTWLKTTPYKEYKLSIASADASFRKYYRLQEKQKSFIFMDSSLEKASLMPFLKVTKKLLNAGVNAPKIYEKNIEEGYLILEDFGNTNLLDVLNTENFHDYYKSAIESIIAMQNTNTNELPIYDKTFLHVEMGLMQEWYLERNLRLTLDVAQKTMLSNTLHAISTIVLSQEQNIFVHRDFHSRNIMLTPKKSLGIIDYQDAMSGAVTYDLVSLLKDCYIAFAPEEIEKLALYFKKKKKLSMSDTAFIKCFDFTGMQRHIKVLGIFSRLYLRDGKHAYLKDIPLVLEYLIRTASKYEETKELAQFLKAIKK